MPNNTYATQLLCRLCRKSDGWYIDIFGPNGTSGIMVYEIIEELLQIPVAQDDGLPCTVCQDCVQRLTDFSDFKVMCIETVINLRSLRTEGLEANGSAVDGAKDTDPLAMGVKTNRMAGFSPSAPRGDGMVPQGANHGTGSKGSANCSSRDGQTSGASRSEGVEGFSSESQREESPQSSFANPSNLLQIPMTSNHGSLQPRVVGTGLVPGGQGSAALNHDGSAADFVVIGDTSEESPSRQSLIGIRSDLLNTPVTSNCGSLQPTMVGITQVPGDQGHAVINHNGTAGGFVVVNGTSVPEKQVGSQCFPGMMLPSLGCGNNVTLISGNIPAFTYLGSGQPQPSLMPFPVGAGHQGSPSIPLG